MRPYVRSFLLLVLLVFSSQAVGAYRIRFSDTSNKWAMVYFDLMATATMHTRYINDWVIGGVNYHQLSTTATYPFPDISLAVREDTLQGKLYFRFNAPTFWVSNTTDTIEHLFFDYNLGVGDTLKISYSGQNYHYRVDSLDSVQLGTDYYKHWVMRNASVGGSVTSYEFIEGVGSNYSPVFHICPVVGFQGQQLRCFSNRRVHPTCQPRIHLPLAGNYPPFDNMPEPRSYFDNDTSCIFTYPPGLDVANQHAQQGPVLIAGTSGKQSIHLPNSWTASDLVVTDAAGRRVFHSGFTGSSPIPVGQYLMVPGVYQYILQNVATGHRYTCRFLFP